MQGLVPEEAVRTRDVLLGDLLAALPADVWSGLPNDILHQNRRLSRQREQGSSANVISAYDGCGEIGPCGLIVIRRDYKE
jgi:hypothetical protein